MKHKILLVEDEAHLRFSLKFNLEAEGYQVVEAANGIEAIEQYEQHGPFAAIVLDVQMPEMNGFEVAEKIRRTDETTQILMLTARAADADRVTGFKAGVDDYITKPFHLEELLLRINRMSERAKIIAEASQSSELAPKKEVLKYKELTLDRANLKLSRHNKQETLTTLEADCLWLFFENPGQVLPRSFLLENVWNLKGYQETRTVDATIVKLRRKISSLDENGCKIESIRGRGYILSELN